MRLSVIIINFKTKDYLVKCLRSLFDQKTSYPFEVIVIDNASENLSDVKKQFPRIVLLTNAVNIGFAGAVNQGIALSETEYIMTLNPDVILEPDYIEQCVSRMEHDPSIASVTGKLLHYDFKHDKKTSVIDSTGLVMPMHKHAYDRGQGEHDFNQYDEKKHVWGVSAAAAIYRRSALDRVKDQFGYFDTRFFMYKEDVDLAWRLHKKGFEALYVPKAVAYHKRGTGIIDANSTILKKLRSRSATKSTMMRKYAWKNQWLMLKKNGITPIAAVYELCIFFYLIIFEPKIFIEKN